MKPTAEKHIINAFLQEFERARIVKLVGREHELTHDSLAEKVAGKRTENEVAFLDAARLLKEKYRLSLQPETKDYLTARQLNFVAPFLKEKKFRQEFEKTDWANVAALVAQSEELIEAKNRAEQARLEKEIRLLKDKEDLQAKKRRAAKQFITVLTVLLIGVAGLAFWAWQQKNAAERSQRMTERAVFAAEMIVVNGLKVQGLYDQAMAEIAAMESYDLTAIQKEQLTKKEEIIASLQELKREGDALISEENYLAGLPKYEAMKRLSSDSFIENLLREKQEERDAIVLKMEAQAKKLLELGQYKDRALIIYDNILAKYDNSEAIQNARASLQGLTD